MHRKDGIRSLQGILDRCIVEDTGCWIWRGAFSNGAARCQVAAGVVSPRIKVTSARSVAWFFKHGPIEPGKVIYRKFDCHDARCVNPDHAMKGTPGDQAKATAKRAGVTVHKLAQLSKARSSQILQTHVVDAIKADLDSGMRQRDIARKHGICLGTVNRINRGKHISNWPG